MSWGGISVCGLKRNESKKMEIWIDRVCQTLLHLHNFIVFKIGNLKFTLPPTPLNMNTSLKAFTGGPKLERIQKERFTILNLERKFNISRSE